MNELTVIQNEQFGEMRIFMDAKDEPWFVAGRTYLAHWTKAKLYLRYLEDLMRRV